MKQCLTCSNQVPDGRVIAKCDGCLALFYYGNALDQIIDLLQESGRPKLGLMQEIAQKAIKAVPRTADPAGWFAVIAIETDRQLTISKHDYANDAVKAAERYDQRGTHRYKHIEVWSIPEEIVIWRDGIKVPSTADPNLWTCPECGSANVAHDATPGRGDFDMDCLDCGTFYRSAVVRNPLDLRAYTIQRRKHLADAKNDCGAKHAASADNLGRSTFTDRDWGAVRRAKEDFGTYRWVQGRLAEIDDLIRWIEQSESEK